MSFARYWHQAAGGGGAAALGRWLLVGCLLLAPGCTGSPTPATAPVAAPGVAGAAVAAPGAGQRIVYDAATQQYREQSSGRPVPPAEIPWPANDGFVSRQPTVLAPGTVVDRYGRPTGRYVGLPGSSISQRGLPAGSEALEYHRYEVLQPLPAEVGPAAPVPAFGAEGGATQYLLQRPIAELLAAGYLRELP